MIVLKPVLVDVCYNSLQLCMLVEGPKIKIGDCRWDSAHLRLHIFDVQWL